jgi:tripartite-type tricarboxylate transporter receptor subunit TctC
MLLPTRKAVADITQGDITMTVRKILTGGALISSLVAGAPAVADEVADFYRGKLMTMLISSNVGGGYDTMARLVSRHIGKHIPGNPTFVNKNMPGAGGIRAANYVYRKAPADGSLISATYRGIPFEPRFRPKATRYKPLEFLWLGSTTKDTSLMLAWHKSKIHTWQDMKNTPFVLGSTRADQQDYAIMVKNLAGLDATKIVWGYGGTNEILLAMERGEVDGITAYSVSSLNNNKPTWVRDGKVRILMQFALEKHPDLPNVPLALDLAKTTQDRRAMELLYARQTMGRPFFAPPGIPRARANALKAAFKATMSDPAYLAEAKRARMEVIPIDGDQLVNLVTRISAFPEEVFQRARNAIGRKGIKVKLASYTATITKVRKKGRRMGLALKLANGKKGSARVHGRRSKITIGGVKAKPGALKAGMSCQFASATAGGIAFKIACK